jgi:tRNA G18 (ribose-2'-O)-methylase SpoU
MNKNKLCLVAIDIRSSHNVGSFFRTCDGFGADLILVGICPRPLSPLEDDRLPHVQQKTNKEIAKTALGAEKQVSWHYFKTALEAIKYLKSKKYKIYAIEQHKNSQSLQNMNTDEERIALVVGAELTGLSDGVLNKCDQIYEIPMKGSKESYNVAVCAGIALYQARK